MPGQITPGAIKPGADKGVTSITRLGHAERVWLMQFEIKQSSNKNVKLVLLIFKTCRYLKQNCRI